MKAIGFWIVILGIVGSWIAGVLYGQQLEKNSPTQPEVISLSPAGQRYFQRVLIPEVQQVQKDGQDLVDMEVQIQHLKGGEWGLNFNTGMLVHQLPQSPKPPETPPVKPTPK